MILWHLQDATRRTGELKRLIPGMTQKMLTQQLKALENQGFVKRKVYVQVPPKVEYSLTKKGKNLTKALLPLLNWSEKEE